MTREEFESAIALFQVAGKKLPYGVMPGTVAGGEMRAVYASLLEWSSYQWNPPQFLSHLPEFSGEDPRASEKPSWLALQKLAAVEVLGKLKHDRLTQLRSECSRRITRTYGARSFTEEIELRLRGDGTTGQDTERDRLRGRYRHWKTWLFNRAETTANDIRAFDPTNDSNW